MKSTNNKITSKVQATLQSMQEPHMTKYIQERLNRDLMDNIANELHKTKSDAIEVKTTFDNNPYPRYEASIELYVFTQQELGELLNRTRLETSIAIKESYFMVDNWKNKKEI